MLWSLEERWSENRGHGGRLPADAGPSDCSGRRGQALVQPQRGKAFWTGGFKRAQTQEGNKIAKEWGWSESESL